MNNLYLKAGLIALTASSLSGNLFAAQANGSAGALVVTPVTVTENATTKLNFGDFVGGASGGTVTISQAGARTKTGADVSLLTVGTTTTPSQGQFDVTGDAARAITVTIDFTGATLSDGTNSMSLAANGADAAAPVALAAGVATVSVGGVLTVGANQVAGAYSTAAPGVPYTVTVNYQ